MKAIAFGNRLSRDFSTASFIDLPVDAKQEILDAINGSIQLLDSFSSHEARTTTASLYLAAPATVSLGMTNGSAVITGHAFVADDLYKTIRIDGDSIDNQIIAESELLHPYTGSTGTATATIYSDAVTIPEPYGEMVGDPRILETRRLLTRWPAASQSRWDQIKRIGEPLHYDVEPNARNQSPPAPSVLRLDALPQRAYRLQSLFTLAPARVLLADLLTSGADLPFRAEHIELYLLPVARGKLSTSDRWKNNGTRSSVAAAGAKAEQDYKVRGPLTLATPNNQVGTEPGF